MKNISAAVLFLYICLNVSAQTNKEDFQSYMVNKTVKEFPDVYRLDSPLNSFICFKNLKAKGTQKLYRQVNSYKIRGFFPKENSSDIEVSEEKKKLFLNTKINEVIIYKDSVAGVLTDYQEQMQIITYLTLEDGKWLNAGEGMGEDVNDARLKFKETAKYFLENLNMINKLKNVSRDSLSFINYLKQNGSEPEEFILNALAKHKIVIYGELHRRKKSWDLIKSIIRKAKFPEEVGTVFMELSSDKQPQLDLFFKNEYPDKELILNIFRDVQIDGWYDRGMYEFIMELWKVNKSLPGVSKIKVIAVDEPRPFRTFKTAKEMEEHFSRTLERNDQMAQIISTTVKANIDKRNTLFIVGVGHAFKTSLFNMSIGSKEGKMRPTAASQLVQLFPEGEVFSIFQHTPVTGNNGIVHSKTRGGIFDYAFSVTGNKPIAFNLKDSPFGKEPFDALYEVSYNKDIGSYEDNYDAYIFLEPLEDEPTEYLFDEIITDDYLVELNKRAKLVNTSVEEWFGVDKATVENIKKTLQFNPDKKRWEGL